MKKLFLNYPPYNDKDIKKKNNSFLNNLLNLTRYHYKNCLNYKKILDQLNFSKKKKVSSIEELPFLPVQIFKKFKMISVDEKKIVKVLLSSGTSSGIPSKIYLDKYNSLNQRTILTKIFQYHFGTSRLPMIFVSQKPSKKNLFDAKMAALNGFSLFGKNHFYMLDDKRKINYVGLNKFLKSHQNQKFIIFGFTFEVFKYLYKILDMKKISGSFKNSILIHGGGWKKMEKVKVEKKLFKDYLKKKLGIKNIHNYYGLIEQTGSIYFECKCGYFITSNYSNILVRNENLEICKDNKRGFIQLMSLLPSSYPGHNIITQDIGEIVNNKFCKCKINGKRFLIHGRAEQAEPRGCSDTIK